MAHNDPYLNSKDKQRVVNEKYGEGRFVLVRPPYMTNTVSDHLWFCNQCGNEIALSYLRLINKKTEPCMHCAVNAFKAIWYTED